MAKKKSKKKDGKKEDLSKKKRLKLKKKKEARKKEARKKEARKKEARKKEARKKEAKKKEARKKEAKKKEAKKKEARKKELPGAGPVPESKPEAPMPVQTDHSSNYKVLDAIKKLRTLKSANELLEFTKGEKRLTITKVIPAALKRLK